MAIIWQKTTAQKHYEVRSAGQTRRLYTSGALHSQYHPARPFAGGVWDLLSIPALAASQAPRTVLLLGLGGGTVIHQLNHLLAPIDIVAIELDPIHIDVAQRFFGVGGDNLTIIEGDAMAWVRSSRRRFDLVIDDIFVDAGGRSNKPRGDPIRSTAATADWATVVSRRVAPAGLLVQNQLGNEQARAAAMQLPVLGYASALLFNTPGYENGVIAAYRAPLKSREARHRITHHCGTVAPDYQLRTLF